MFWSRLVGSSHSHRRDEERRVTSLVTSTPLAVRLGTSDGVKDERRNERRDREVGTEGSGSEVGYEDDKSPRFILTVNSFPKISKMNRQSCGREKSLI